MPVGTSSDNLLARGSRRPPLRGERNGSRCRWSGAPLNSFLLPMKAKCHAGSKATSPSGEERPSSGDCGNCKRYNFGQLTATRPAGQTRCLQQGPRDLAWATSHPVNADTPLVSPPFAARDCAAQYRVRGPAQARAMASAKQKKPQVSVHVPRCCWTKRVLLQCKNSLTRRVHFSISCALQYLPLGETVRRSAWSRPPARFSIAT